jgi:acetyl esterase/lipase
MVSWSGRAALATLLLIGAHLPTQAQVANLPPELQKLLDQVGPVWGKAIGPNIETVTRAFQPVLKAAPKSGVTTTKNLAYGNDPKQVLDVYQPDGKSGVPVVIFVHGGAYVEGDKDAFGEMYSNVPIWFARQGVLGINATYRLAPQAMWPSGPEDVRGMVAWARGNVARYGGDPNRIYLIGHSAGATHIANYVFDKALQPAEGPEVAGAVLISGRYWVTYNPNDPVAKNLHAYFGTDGAAYANRSPITHIRDTTPIPVFVVICEYEQSELDVRGAELLAALCERDGACPRFLRLERHNHLSEVAAFNTADEQLGREILDFMARGR